jgi:RNA polymerase sigma-70 factor (ECF subfamily)
VDRTLVELAIQGDEEAYAGLMAMAGDRLIAIAYRILRDLDRAEDAVQVTLVSAWRDLPTLREPDRFEA